MQWRQRRSIDDSGWPHDLASDRHRELGQLELWGGRASRRLHRCLSLQKLDTTTDDDRTIAHQTVPTDFPSIFSLRSVADGGSGVSNGDFEQGAVGWSEFSLHDEPLIVDSANLPITPHSGDWAAWLGGLHDEESHVRSS